MLNAVIVGLSEEVVVEDVEVVDAVLPSSSFIELPLYLVVGFVAPDNELVKVVRLRPKSSK